MLAIAFALLASIAVQANTADNSSSSSAETGWEHYNWLPSNTTQGETFSPINSQQVVDPFAVLSSGALWEDSSGLVWKRPMADSLTLSYATTSQTLSTDYNNTGEAVQSQDLGLQFQPDSALTLRTELHDSAFDGAAPSQGSMTDGARFSAEGHLPFNSTLTLGYDTSSTTAAAASTAPSTAQTFDAQYEQPLGKSPFSAVLKSHYAETESGGVTSQVPSLDQALVIKAKETRIELGLRGQHYQDVPGVTNELSETLYADWSQRIVPQVTWHSYAEVLGARGSSEPTSVTPNANGSVPSSAPVVNPNSAALPTSLSDESLTFSTGPSIQLQKDISANIEYSNRWDRNPLSADQAQEQRVSVSLKGSF